MQLEQLVPSLELCRRLKELGYPQDDSAFYWDDTQDWIIYTNEEVTKGNFIESCIAAPLAGELLKHIEELRIKEGRTLYFLTIERIGECWQVGYANSSALARLVALDDEQLSTAIAKLIIWLVENGHVKFGDSHDTEI